MPDRSQGTLRSQRSGHPRGRAACCAPANGPATSAQPPLPMAHRTREGGRKLCHAQFLVFRLQIQCDIRRMGGIIQPKVWTIGHSTRPVEEFLALLRENGIEVLADVRRYPGSRRHPQFGEAQMAASLRDAGVNYEHMPELGGRRPALRDSPNTAWRNTAFRGYADHMETSEFADGTNRLMNLATSKRLTIMCAEALWWQCHRGLIAD